MNKRLVFITLTLAALICLAGCDNDHYEQGDADLITEKGAEMMRTWLDEHMPDAEMTECSAFIQNIAYTSHEYLTDYAAGRFRLDGEETVFAIDDGFGVIAGTVCFCTVAAFQCIAAGECFITRCIFDIPIIAYPDCFQI